MPLFPATISDAELIAFLDSWAALLETGDYVAAYKYIDHDPHQGWTPDLLQAVIEAYGEAKPGQQVTVTGAPTDVHQRKEVDRWPINRNGSIGQVWYDLNIDGHVSDLTATFDLHGIASGIQLRLNDIHVM